MCTIGIYNKNRFDFFTSLIWSGRDTYFKKISEAFVLWHITDIKIIIIMPSEPARPQDGGDILQSESGKKFPLGNLIHQSHTTNPAYYGSVPMDSKLLCCECEN